MPTKPPARAICFVVMPFSTKPTGLEPGEGPAEVDFDALWTHALAPAIEDAGYAPVRADQDAGALIIVEMIERLAYSDLVIADISIGNANVYYEIGVRHASRRSGCVLVGADWSRPLFDIDQMPRVVYPLADGDVGEEAAAEVRQRVSAGIAGLSDGESPVFKAVPAMRGLPKRGADELQKQVKSFRAEMLAIADVLARMRTVRRLLDPARRGEEARALRDEIDRAGEAPQSLRLEMLSLLRDCAGMEDALTYAEGFPISLQQQAYVREQTALAIAKSKQRGPEEAIGRLEQLIVDSGGSSERFGLLGGRYKQLYNAALAAGDAAAAQRALDQSIYAYERGMYADLNDYYPSSNMPRLLRQRGRQGDEEAARSIAALVVKACQRTRELGLGDDWLNPTLLGAAFDAADVRTARALVEEVRRESPSDWQLSSALGDLWVSAALAPRAALRIELEELAEQLEALLPEDQRPARPPEAPPATEPASQATKAKKSKKAKAKKAKDDKAAAAASGSTGRQKKKAKKGKKRKKRKK